MKSQRAVPLLLPARAGSGSAPFGNKMGKILDEVLYNLVQKIIFQKVLIPCKLCRYVRQNTGQSFVKNLDGKVYHFVQLYFALPAISTRRAASRNVVLGIRRLPLPPAASFVCSATPAAVPQSCPAGPGGPAQSARLSPLLPQCLPPAVGGYFHAPIGLHS